MFKNITLTNSIQFLVSFAKFILSLFLFFAIEAAIETFVFNVIAFLIGSTGALIVTFAVILIMLFSSNYRGKIMDFSTSFVNELFNVPFVIARGIKKIFNFLSDKMVAV